MSKGFVWFILWTFLSKNVCCWLGFPFFWKKWIISNLIFKIGLRPWIKKLFGSSREHLFFLKKLFYWICVSSKLGFLKCFFRKLDWGHEKNIFRSFCEHFITKNAVCWLDFPFFKIRLSHIWFSKIGLKLCVKDFLGSSCELFSITAFWLDFSFLKIRLSQNWFSQNWIAAMSKWFFWIKLWTFIFQ